MYAHYENGVATILPTVGAVVDGVVLANLLTLPPEALAEINVYQVVEEQYRPHTLERPIAVSYELVDRFLVQTTQYEPLPMDQVRPTVQALVDQHCGRLLAPTDFMVLRAYEGRKSIPKAVQQQRTQIWKDCQARTKTVQAAKTVHDLLAVTAELKEELENENV